jgi:hypothetical protein
MIAPQLAADVFTASGRYQHCLRLSCGYLWEGK